MIGRIAALNRFISKLSDKCHPLYDTLRKNKGFAWGNNKKKPLQNLKGI